MKTGKVQLTNNRALLWWCAALLLTVAAVLICIQQLCIEEAEGKTIYVDDDGTAEYENIQDAVDAADENDTVYVRAGTYMEHVKIRTRINLEGAGNRTTIVDGEGTGNTLIVEASWCNVSGFMIKGGWDNNWDCGGIVVRSSRNHIFENNCTLNNENGIVLYYSTSYNTVERNTCYSNEGSGIKFSDSDNNLVTGNTFTSNSESGVFFYSHASYNTLSRNNCSSNEGRGIWVYAMSRHNTLSDNLCYGNGGSGITVYQHGEYSIISRNICSNNQGDGIRLDYYSESIKVDNNILRNNSKGIVIRDSRYNRIRNNTCTGHEYDGLYIYNQLYYSTGTIIEDNDFSFNKGRGMYITYTSSNEIHRNTCNSNGKQGIYMKSSGKSIENNTCSNNSLQGIYIYTTSSNIIVNNTCSQNTGQGIYLDSAHSNGVYWNTCEYNELAGIHIGSSKNNRIRNNSCSSSVNHGICLDSSTGPNTLSTNLMTGCGIGISGESVKEWGSHAIDTSNTVNHKPVCYITDTNALEVQEGAGQIIVVNSSRILIENQDIGNTHFAVTVAFSYNVSIIDSTIRSNRFGFRIYQNLICNLSGNTITGNEIGIYLEASSSWTMAHENDISGNTLFGINATDNDGYTINATDNWWGHQSGPFHAANNSLGTGDNVTDHVVFQPWLSIVPGNQIPIAVISSISPSPALDTDTIRFTGGGTDDGSIERYAWRSSTDGEFYNGTDAECDHSDLSAGTHTIYLKVQDDRGAWSEEASIPLTVSEDSGGPGPEPAIAQAPAWQVGDRWEWTASYDFGENLEFNITEEVTGTDVLKSPGYGPDFVCYEISKEVHWPGNGTTETTTIWLSNEDFLIVDEEDWHLPEASAYLSGLDFPFEAGDVWGDDDEYQCTGTETLRINDQDFKCFRIKADDDGEVTTFWYSPSHGNIVKSENDFGSLRMKGLSGSSGGNGDDDDESIIAALTGNILVTGGIVAVAIVIVAVTVAVKARSGQGKEKKKEKNGTVERDSAGTHPGAATHGLPPQMTPSTQLQPPVSQMQPASLPGFEQVSSMPQQTQQQSCQQQAAMPQSIPTQAAPTVPQTMQIHSQPQVQSQQPFTQQTQPVPTGGVLQQQQARPSQAVAQQPQQTGGSVASDGHLGQGPEKAAAWQCPKCGSTMDGNYRFCTGCGTKKPGEW